MQGPQPERRDTCRQSARAGSAYWQEYGTLWAAPTELERLRASCPPRLRRSGVRPARGRGRRRLGHTSLRPGSALATRAPLPQPCCSRSRPGLPQRAPSGLGRRRHADADRRVRSGSPVGLPTRTNPAARRIHRSQAVRRMQRRHRLGQLIRSSEPVSIMWRPPNPLMCLVTVNEQDGRQTDVGWRSGDEELDSGAAWAAGA